MVMRFVVNALKYFFKRKDICCDIIIIKGKYVERYIIGSLHQILDNLFSLL